MRALSVLAALALLSACNAAPEPDDIASQEASQPTFAPLASIRTAGITLPADDETFAAGPQGDLLNRNCLACHSKAMVHYQPPLTRQQWTATVDKMRTAYGAPIEPAETQAIVDALMSTAPARR